MIQIRKAEDRGHFNHGWLDTYHMFSFGDYHDPDHHQFRSLRVMNEDRIEPGQGFGTHPHRDMEIVTYVLSGALEHRDSMGNGEVLRSGVRVRLRRTDLTRHVRRRCTMTSPARTSRFAWSAYAGCVNRPLPFSSGQTTNLCERGDSHSKGTVARLSTRYDGESACLNAKGAN